MDYERTGVFLDEDTNKELSDLAREASSTPVITVGSGTPSFSALAWDRVKRRIYDAALEAGLPEIEGYYGLDGETGELLAPPGQMGA